MLLLASDVINLSCSSDSANDVIVETLVIPLQRSQLCLVKANSSGEGATLGGTPAIYTDNAAPPSRRL